MCVKENGITTYGGFIMRLREVACEKDPRAEEAVAFNMLWLDATLQDQHNLPTVTLAIKGILLKICITYRNSCQLLGQDTGQPTGWIGVFRGAISKFRLEPWGAPRERAQFL